MAASSSSQDHTRRPAFARRLLTLVALGVVCGAALAGCAGLAIAQPAAAAPVVQPCARAQALLKSGYLTEAESAFKADLGKDPCAVAGVAAAKDAQTADAAATADHRFNNAVTMIRSLEAEGFESEARKKAQDLVAAFPTRDIPEDIRAIDQPIGWWRQLRGDVGPPIRVGVEAVIALLAGLLIIALTVRGVAALARRVFVRKFTVHDLSGASDDDARGQAGVLAAELARIGRSSGGDHVRRVSPNEGDFELPDALTTAYPQAGIAAALISLLDRVLPRRLMEVSASALPADPVRGVGLTVAIEKRGGRRVSETTVWEAQFWHVHEDRPLAERLERLMLPAAVWLAYQPKLGGGPKANRALGTDNWTSYAHFAIGERAQQHGDMTDARRAYFKALDVDAANLGARLNLAGLALYGPADEGSAAVGVVSHALADWLLMADDVRERMGEQPMRYRWLYLRAALHVAGAHPQGARETAGQLWDEIKPPRPGRPGPEPARLAEQMRWPTYVLLQSARLYGGPHQPDLSELQDQWWNASTLYNLACYHAREARLLPPGAPESHATGSAPEHLAKARGYVRDAIDRADEPGLMSAMAKSDPVLAEVVELLTAQELVALTGEKPDEPDAKDIKVGRSLGIRIREAIRTAVRDGHISADARP